MSSSESPGISQRQGLASGLEAWRMAVYSIIEALLHLLKRTALRTSATCHIFVPRQGAFPRCMQATSVLSHLGARELEHDDLVSLLVRDVNLVTVHNDFRYLTLQIDVNTLYDVA